MTNRPSFTSPNRAHNKNPRSCFHAEQLTSQWMTLFIFHKKKHKQTWRVPTKEHKLGITVPKQQPMNHPKDWTFSFIYFWFCCFFFTLTKKSKEKSTRFHILEREDRLKKNSDLTDWQWLNWQSPSWLCNFIINWNVISLSGMEDLICFDYA